MSQVIQTNMFASDQYSLESVVRNGVAQAINNFGVIFSDTAPDSMTSCGWTFLGTAEITITSEVTDLREAALTGLDAAQKELDAKHSKAQTELNARRSNLLAIEHNPSGLDHE